MMNVCGEITDVGAHVHDRRAGGQCELRRDVALHLGSQNEGLTRVDVMQLRHTAPGRPRQERAAPPRGNTLSSRGHGWDLQTIELSSLRQDADVAATRMNGRSRQSAHPAVGYAGPASAGARSGPSFSQDQHTADRATARSSGNPKTKRSWVHTRDGSGTAERQSGDLRGFKSRYPDQSPRAEL